MEKFDILSEYEYKEAELDEITTMLWFLIEDYYIADKNTDLHTKANNYDRLLIYLNNLHRLLYNLDIEMKDFIKNEYNKNKTIEEK